MRLVIMLLILLSALPLSPALRRDELVIWNVGQGLWVTWIEGDFCRHFDAGGERWPLKQVRRECRQKQNELYLSHWDWDHVGGVGSLRRLLPGLCLAGAPAGKAPSAKKQNMLKGIRRCERQTDSIQEVQWRREGKSSNDASRVWLLKGLFLLPGDSTSNEERRWSRAMNFSRTKGLILGHHGSRTSSSEELLRRLPNLKWAIASARKKRYGHPHAVIEKRLRQKHIPLLRTEDWGHFIFQL